MLRSAYDIAHTEGELGDQQWHDTVLNFSIVVVNDYICLLSQMLTPKLQHFGVLL